MYKQKCVGSKGPLMPVFIVVMVGWMLYSICYTGVRFFSWTGLVAVGVALLYSWMCAVIWRYTRVKVEYTWLSGELVIRSGRYLGNIRIAIRQENMFGLREHGRSTMIGQIQPNCHKMNFCATLWGRIAECCILYCKDSRGKMLKIYFQPSQELREMLTCALLEQQNSLSD